MLVCMCGRKSDLHGSSGVTCLNSPASVDATLKALIRMSSCANGIKEADEAVVVNTLYICHCFEMFKELSLLLRVL